MKNLRSRIRASNNKRLVDKLTARTMTLRISIAAFCIENETVNVVEALRNQRQYSRCEIVNQEGSIGAARNFLAENETPNLLISKQIYLETYYSKNWNY